MAAASDTDHLRISGGEVLPEPAPGVSWSLLPAFGVSLSAFLLFGVQLSLAGYPVLVASLVSAYVLNRPLAKDLLLIALGIGIVSTISVEADISWGNFVLMGVVLALAVAVPYLTSRHVFKDHAIRFPWRGGKPWTRFEKAWLVAVPVLGWLILPFYFIRSGVYQNWPVIDVTDWSELGRFFVGVNAVGTWDELFFICTAFALFRRHFPVWQANILQAIIFVSFLWELGYQSWGPLLTIPFALLQGYIFTLTRSLTYVLIVHLTFDLVVFLAIVHSHNPGWAPIFLY